jgi:hypothetical protein
MTFRINRNVIKVFVLVVLLSALVCSEVPELAKLMDDTSNDFTTPICLIQELRATIAAQVTATVISPALGVLASQLSSAHQPSIFPGSSRDVLLLCSTLRT